MGEGADTNVTEGYRIAGLIVGGAGVIAAVWLLLFGGPALLNAHSDGGAVLALLVYLGVPAVAAWGGPRLWDFIASGEIDHE